jgi:hypothetical protein
MRFSAPITVAGEAEEAWVGPVEQFAEKPSPDTNQV